MRKPGDALGWTRRRSTNGDVAGRSTGSAWWTRLGPGDRGLFPPLDEAIARRVACERTWQPGEYLEAPDDEDEGESKGESQSSDATAPTEVVEGTPEVEPEEDTSAADSPDPTPSASSSSGSGRKPVLPSVAKRQALAGRAAAPLGTKTNVYFVQLTGTCQGCHVRDTFMEWAYLLGGVATGKNLVHKTVYDRDRTKGNTQLLFRVTPAAWAQILPMLGKSVKTTPKYEGVFCVSWGSVLIFLSLGARMGSQDPSRSPRGLFFDGFGIVWGSFFNVS